MDRPRVVRLLRIAASAVCGMLCILLIVLWVRSYWWHDDVVGCVSDKLYFQFGSSPGTGWLVLSTRELPGTRWKVHTHSRDEILNMIEGLIPLPHPLLGEFSQKFDSLQGRLFGSIGVPYWFAISLIVGTTVAPWIRWRFSLRTLLIATTLIAVLLGVVVWLSS